MSARHSRRPFMIVAMTLVIGWMTIVPGGGAVTPARADDLTDARNLVDVSRMAFENFVKDAHLSEPLRAILPQAKAVLIYPQILRLAFIFGGSGGSGVLLAHDEKAGVWSGPAFYTIGQFSFGLQAGGDAATIVLVALTDRGLSALLSTSAKLGADASVALIAMVVLIMDEKKIRRLPVVNEKNRLVGIISRADILKAILRKLA